MTTTAPVLQQIVYLGMLCAATHWILARSEITRFLWSRAPDILDRLLRCSGCSGFWLGIGWAETFGHNWRESLVAGVLGAFLTPVFESVLMWGLRESAVPEPSWSQAVHLISGLLDKWMSVPDADPNGAIPVSREEYERICMLIGCEVKPEQMDSSESVTPVERPKAS